MSIRRMIGTLPLSLSLFTTACQTKPQEVLLNAQLQTLATSTAAVQGQVQWPSSFSTQATVNDIQAQATVSLIYPGNHPTLANQTIATGLTTGTGAFVINPDSNFTPAAGTVFVLEASKRVGGPGSDLLSLRTYLRWTGSTWTSITGSTIQLNAMTTAITIMDHYDGSFVPGDTIGSVSSGLPSQLGANNPVAIEAVRDLVTLVLQESQDPSDGIELLNGKYMLKQGNDLRRAQVIAQQGCPGCQLQGVDLSGLNLSNADFTDANLTGANLSASQFINANFTRANLISAHIHQSSFNNADFTQTTWTDGSLCSAGILGECLPFSPIPSKGNGFLSNVSWADGSVALNNISGVDVRNNKVYVSYNDGADRMVRIKDLGNNSQSNLRIYDGNPLFGQPPTISGISVGNDGSLWSGFPAATDGYNLYEFAANGTRTARHNVASNTTITDVAVDPGSGLVYLAAPSSPYQGIIKFNKSNVSDTQLYFSGSTALNPVGLGLDSNGHVYVADGLSGKVIKFSKNDGSRLLEFDGKGVNGTGQQFSAIGDVAVDPRNGDIYVLAVPGSGVRIFRYDSSGNFIHSFSHTNLTSPQKITVDSTGNILVAELSQKQVMIFGPGQ